jgi:hypothetical protein
LFFQVNGVPVKAFVDSGAQMTIMTHEFASKCFLTRLMDKRFAGMAVGVGSSPILGRIHQAPLKVGRGKQGIAGMSEEGAKGTRGRPLPSKEGVRDG